MYICQCAFLVLSFRLSATVVSNPSPPSRSSMINDNSATDAGCAKHLVPQGFDLTMLREQVASPGAPEGFAFVIDQHANKTLFKDWLATAASAGHLTLPSNLGFAEWGDEPAEKRLTEVEILPPAMQDTVSPLELILHHLQVLM